MLKLYSFPIRSHVVLFILSSAGLPVPAPLAVHHSVPSPFTALLFVGTGLKKPYAIEENLPSTVDTHARRDVASILRLQLSFHSLFS